MEKVFLDSILKLPQNPRGIIDEACLSAFPNWEGVVEVAGTSRSVGYCVDRDSQTKSKSPDRNDPQGLNGFLEERLVKSRRRDWVTAPSFSRSGSGISCGPAASSITRCGGTRMALQSFSRVARLGDRLPPSTRDK